MPAVPDLHPEAQEEYLESFRWYLERNPHVALAFQEEFEDSLALIQKAPLTWPPYVGATRRFLLRRFPFSVIYEPGPPVVVIAVAHHKRRPFYWRERQGQ